MDKSEDDDELVALRTSTAYIRNLQASVPRLLWKHNSFGQQQLHRHVKTRDLERVISWIEPFQGEPYLLDTALRTLIPPLVRAYLEHATRDPATRTSLVGCIRLDSAISRILYTFCKVRGEKVVAGFLSNEPTHLDLILSLLRRSSSSSSHPWEIDYILLVWLRHLLLAPFDLVTIRRSNDGQYLPSSFSLPDSTPDVVHQIIALAERFLPSLTRCQDAAAKVLARLVLRPDVAQIDVLDSIVNRSIALLSAGTAESDTISQETVGHLRFLVGITAPNSGLVSTRLLSLLTPLCLQHFDRLRENDATSSAVSRKLLLKVLRNFAIRSIDHAEDDNETNLIEEVVERGLGAVGDIDTLVRFAAAKTLSLIVAKLDSDFAGQVIGAIIDQYDADHYAGYSSSDPRQWHGLTLAIAHCLFRRTIDPLQLPEVINVILLALNFDKRAITGNHLGTNVRDAACYAIWSMTRRYTTGELLRVDTRQIHALSTGRSPNIISGLAVELMVAACLDPEGNIRRGCSAALQEMVGRHPDVVPRGIDLIQIIDYQAVGLRRRAMTELVYKSIGDDAGLWAAYVDGLLGWRGICSHDALSRSIAADGIGCLSVMPITVDPVPVLVKLSEIVIQSQLDMESRHGALLAVVCICSETLQSDLRARSTIFDTLSAAIGKLVQEPWLIDSSPRAIKAQQPQATAFALRIFLKFLSQDDNDRDQLSHELTVALSLVIEAVLSRSEDAVTKAVPDIMASIRAMELRIPSLAGTLFVLDNCTRSLQTDGKRPVLHGAARAFALASCFGYTEGVDVLGGLISLLDAEAIEWRVVGLRALELIVAQPMSGADQARLSAAFIKGMRDYTITERGDVGSLVRTQALKCVQEVVESDDQYNGIISDVLHANVRRLSLEKLDKVRSLAWQTLRLLMDEPDSCPIDDVSCTGYFSWHLNSIEQCDSEHRAAIVEGFCSCAGAGNEHLLQAARTAVAKYLGSDNSRLTTMLDLMSNLLAAQISRGDDTQGPLQLLSYILEIGQISQIPSTFKWITLLSRVQKSHYRSSIVPKILAAIDVYRSLGRIEVLIPEVRKRLVRMAKSSPFPRIRYAAAEALWSLTEDEGLCLHDLAGGRAELDGILQACLANGTGTSNSKRPVPMIDVR